MKYSSMNKPLVCMMTQSTCYKGTRKFTPKGILWHSTGANNPWLKRYVQPDDNAANKAELLNLIGTNAYRNDWNHIDRQAGLNFWIGKLADGTVAAVQTMPFDYRPWGCGSGSKGSGNDVYIQFEICEDGLNDSSYFNACYLEAIEMTAYLCKMYGINPYGTISYNGLTIPTITDHTGSHSLGIGSNHGDVQHWSRKFGKTMENVRNDVKWLLDEGNSTPAPKSTPAPTPTPTPSTPTVYYRVRKSWEDKGSQIGAFTVLENAKLCVDANPGYAAFDDGGQKVYPSDSGSSFKVRVTIADLNYRKGPSISYDSWGYIAPGVYTIVDEQDGWGLLKSYADKRNGWINLSYAKRV